MGAGGASAAGGAGASKVGGAIGSGAEATGSLVGAAGAVGSNDEESLDEDEVSDMGPPCWCGDESGDVKDDRRRSVVEHRDRHLDRVDADNRLLIRLARQDLR